MRLRCRMEVGEADLRPGGTVSGPTMFTLADCAFYMVTLAMIGLVSLITPFLEPVYFDRWFKLPASLFSMIVPHKTEFLA